MKRQALHHRISSQRGVILIVALVMLLVMTTLGITTMTDSTLQERMAGNSRHQVVARLNAEFALNSAEAYLLGLESGNGIPDGTLISEFGDQNKTGSFVAKRIESFTGGATGTAISPINFDVTDATQWTNTPNGEEVARPANNPAQLNPRYVIEYMGRYQEPSRRQHVFRIIAIGWSANQNIYSVIQSYYLSTPQ